MLVKLFNFIISKLNYIKIVMQKLDLNFLKDLIPEKRDKIQKYRPQVLYVPRPPARRKYQTAIRPPDRNFFNLMSQRNVYLWVVAKKNMHNGIKQKIQDSYGSVKGKTHIILSFGRLLETTHLYWVEQCPCQVVIFEDLFEEAFPSLSMMENACGFHVVSADNVQIAKIARQNRKIRNIYDDESFILTMVKQNMQRLAITKQQKQIQNAALGGQQFKRLLIRNIVFPNFIKLAKHDKSEHNQYRLHLIGLRRLTQDDKLASKDKFIEFSRKKFSKDEQFIQQYSNNSFTDSKDILRFYTLDSFFYRVLNNTLRIAKNTEQFFSIGEPFNRVFDAIKCQYQQGKQFMGRQTTVYRGADLTGCECEYLEQNIGKYIQINGFISTSKKLSTAKNFAKQRKNNTIFQINIKKVDQKYKQYDYGYADLQLNKVSAFDQDQVLFNALNIFKIVGKQSRQNFDLYLLEYGSIFEILDKDPKTLSQNDKYAYYSFKELRDMNQAVKDIGEVYLRTHEPEKAIEIYEFQIMKLNESVQPVEKQLLQHAIIKAADAYLANCEPDKALKYYQRIFKKKKQKKTHKKNSLILQQTHTSGLQTEIIQISTKVSTIHNNTDKFQQAEQNCKEALKQFQTQLTNAWSMQMLWPKIQLQWQLITGKISQLLYQEAFDILKQMEKNLLQVSSKIKKLEEPYQQKKIRFKLTEIYQLMAQIVDQLETKKSKSQSSQMTRISEISSSFRATFDQLIPLVERGSYEEGLLQIRKIQISRRTKQFDEANQTKSYERAISLIKKNTSQTDQILPKMYNSYADFQKKSSKKLDNLGAINLYKKQLKIQTVIFGTNDPKPLNTKMQIAICQRDDRNTIQSLQQFSQAYHTKIYKSQTKYSTHAKVLFNMAQAYTDKGDDGLALKSYKQAHQILQKRLSKNDLQKSVLKFKIKLKIGRLYMSSSLRNEVNLQEAQKNLLQYHTFVKNYYEYDHVDVALSHNCLGALYSTLKKFILSKQNFQLSVQIYQNISGLYCLDVAKTKSNLAICFAQLKQIRKATKTLLSSQQIFQKIYSDLGKHNPFQYQSKFIKAQIQTIAGEYEQAIRSCEQSMQAQQLFLQSKRKSRNQQIQNVDLYKSDINQYKNDSYFLLEQMRKPQYNSLNVNGMEGQNSFKIQPTMSVMPLRKSKSERYNQNLNSIVNYTTQHGFKCEFKISQCFIYLKKYQEVKNRLQKLKDSLQKRILEEKVNTLFKDNVHSKKQTYLKKSQQYLHKVYKALQSKSRKDQKTNKHQQSKDYSKNNKTISQLVREPYTIQVQHL